ncbi:MAG TPA: TusE/DsrC/DsvC family sulfur relay protein [Rhodocyclaceae bacterium]|nr:TusE/DsrC/DsvC family sulfur relay protein [Rhodocyclaceae bacterium]
MIVINGKEIPTDTEGYLANLEDWSEEIAAHLSERDNLQLTDGHWEIIKFIRQYYEEYRTAPNLRTLQKLLKEEFGEEKSDKKYLFELFPYGPAKQGARYAGMPKPTGCV